MWLLHAGLRGFKDREFKLSILEGVLVGAAVVAFSWRTISEKNKCPSDRRRPCKKGMRGCSSSSSKSLAMTAAPTAEPEVSRFQLFFAVFVVTLLIQYLARSSVGILLTRCLSLHTMCWFASQDGNTHLPCQVGYYGPVDPGADRRKKPTAYKDISIVLQRLNINHR